MLNFFKRFHSRNRLQNWQIINDPSNQKARLCINQSGQEFGRFYQLSRLIGQLVGFTRLVKILFEYYAASRCDNRDAKSRMVLAHCGSLMIQTFWNPMANLETSISMGSDQKYRTKQHSHTDACTVPFKGNSANILWCHLWILIGHRSRSFFVVRNLTLINEIPTQAP